jgi:hypothetical protein
MTAEDALDKIAKASGWGANPDPDDPEDALYEINRILWNWANNSP